MKKAVAVTAGLVWLLLLLAVSTPAFSSSPFLVAYAEATENTWATMTEMPTPRTGVGVAVVNGKIYAIGGYNKGYLSTNEMYDPATDTWTTKKPMPTPRDYFGIAVVDNKIYVIGGGSIESRTNANEVYDPSTDTWETKTSMPTNRSQLCANVVNGKIYLIGGNTGSQYGTSLNEVYDPSTDTWTTKTPSPTAVAGYASAVVNNKIYVIGGMYGGSILSSTQIYTPETDTWSNGTSSPSGLPFAAGAATTGNMAPKRIYVIGGSTLLPFSENYIYDPEEDVWSTGASMPTARGGLGVAVVDDILYAIGGVAGGALHYYGANEQYTPIGYVNVPPTISIVLPENKTYNVNHVPLTFTADKSALWIRYSLNGQANLTITGNTTLTELADAPHSITVYATDIFGTEASAKVYFTIDTPPNITILSPQNKTYNATDIPLTFNIDETAPWIGYSLDNQANVTITGNTTLTGLADGAHSITVYANDTAGNTAASETIHFSIAQPAEPFPTWIAAATATGIIIAAGILIYFTKLKKKKEHP